ncbi:MAG: helix-turn-helix domain-containing protein [Parabacteroides gordonii]|uniref:helix-turn-helix domain-containing protein n=1 Tax=Parabacteroides gordonii TaxID=574930 RepID=UPI003A840EAD
MLSLLFQILVICTSLLAWGVLSIAGISLLQYGRYNKKTILTTFITLVLCVVSFYNSWYEGLFLFRKIALISSLNSWAFTLLTPLFYLYFRFRITNRLPDARQWRRHLLPPGVLAAIYIAMTLFNPIPDKLIYSWHEFGLDRSAWWVSFRISCYLLLAVQLFVYLPRLLSRINDNTPQIQIIKRELLCVLCFIFISVMSMLTPSYICNILYNLSLILIGVYLLKQSVFYRTVKRKIGFYLLPYFFIRTEANPKEKIEVSTQFNQEEGERIISLLKSPDILHNPDMTLKILASELGTNATSLSHYFNQQLGVRFSDYLTALRLDEAEAWLKDTNIKVIEISELVGFQTSSTFYQAFNARHHIPPSQWRKKMKLNS